MSASIPSIRTDSRYRTSMCSTPSRASAERGVIHETIIRSRSGWPDLDQPYPTGFRPLPALGETEGDAFTFIEAREPGSFKSRDVDECVLATTIPSDESEALVDIEPFHGAGLFDRCAGRSLAGCRRPETRTRWCRRRCGARIDAQHIGDVWAFMSRPDADLDGFARLHDADATLSQHAPV